MAPVGRIARDEWSANGRSSPLKRWWAGLLALSLIIGGVFMTSTPASALPRGEAETFTGGLVISNYIMPNGKRAYCVEVQMREPSGYITNGGRVGLLPGREGVMHAYDNPAGMRMMNYLIDTHGQNGDSWSAAGVQLTIWRMREDFRATNPELNAKMQTLRSSKKGRDLIAKSDALYADAKKNAVAPVAPKPVTGSLTIEADPAGTHGRFRVAYPKGTTALSVSGGSFVRNGEATLSVPADAASARYVDAEEDADEILVSGSWKSTGTRGWGAELEVYNTVNASGATGQRVGVAVGRSAAKTLDGTFDAVRATPPPPLMPPVASSQAQPSAEIGGVMVDELIVREAEQSTLQMWPDAVADFTAYLLPEPGAPKFDPAWRPLDGDPVWTEEELAAMSDEERCVAQPVYGGGDIRVAGVGTYTSESVTVRSLGTIHWVERIVSHGEVVHEGECGLANETTRIEQPGVETLAPERVLLGESLTDTATVTGTLVPDVSYDLVFEAFRGEVADPGAEAVPVCTDENRLFRSEPVPVTETGEVRSPGFTARFEHGERVWWVETLRMDTGDGPIELHRGECGLENETTVIERPSVETKAREHAAIGDDLTDTAILTGGFEENDEAAWELGFAAYQADSTTGDDERVPACTEDTLLFTIDPVRVTGPGEVTSAPVTAQHDWLGEIWWVETLWLTQGDTRTAVHTGECGLANETTRIDGPAVVTHAEPAVSLGDLIGDTATITGPLSEREDVRHEVVFEGFRGIAELTGTETASCTADNRLFTTDPVTVDEPVPHGAEIDVRSPEVTALPAFGDTVWWVETLVLVETDGDGGETRSELGRGACGLPDETTTVQGPAVSTTAVAEARVGEPMFDIATVTGVLTEREDVEFRLTFDAYERTRSGALTCAPEHRIDELSDSEGVRVTGPGTYRSKSVTTTSEHVGMGGYVETLVMIEGDKEHLVHRGACGAEGESFSITPAAAPTPLAETGGNPLPVSVIIGGALAAIAGAVLLVLRRRRDS